MYFLYCFLSHKPAGCNKQENNQENTNDSDIDTTESTITEYSLEEIYSQGFDDYITDPSYHRILIYPMKDRMYSCFPLYRFFLDVRKVIFVMVLLCLNIMTMFFVGKYGAARQSGEIFGDYHPQARVGIKYTVNSAAEFYDNIAFVCENAEKNKEQSGEIFGSYQENLLKIYKDLHTRRSSRNLTNQS